MDHRWPSDEALAAIRTIDLTTIGRRSGRPSRIEIWWHRVADRFIITGTPGPRDWYANVLADPSVVVHVGLPGGTVDLAATATVVDDPVFRRTVFTDPDTSWYAANADLEELIATAPMIDLAFTDRPSHLGPDGGPDHHPDHEPDGGPDHGPNRDAGV